MRFKLTIICIVFIVISSYSQDMFIYVDRADIRTDMQIINENANNDHRPDSTNLVFYNAMTRVQVIRHYENPKPIQSSHYKIKKYVHWYRKKKVRVRKRKKSNYCKV